MLWMIFIYIKEVNSFYKVQKHLPSSDRSK